VTSDSGEFQPERTEIARARRFATGFLGEAHPLAEAVEVVVSEMAANAVKHAASGFRLTVDLQPMVVRVEVADAGGGWPCPAPMDPTARGGRGLQIVDALSDGWGVERRPAGKVVWAELRLGGLEGIGRPDGRSGLT
jgi:anti-sigma regulatory factor (Ser/Thr protein kinase)